jgi:cell division protein FtsI (penicillin-binding protein 3)
MMVENEAQHGCAIVMEVKTGKIKAIANLGRASHGNYFEDYNYAITPSEPGSTFKLATMLTVLEDKKASLNTPVDLNGGVWQVAGSTVYDSEKHGLHTVSLKQAFEHSSNVGMAKIAWMNYSNNPSRFVNHLRKLRMDTLTGIDLKGEIRPTIYSPSNRKHWSNTTLPWMAFGYNLMVTPLQVLSLYNAVANDGVMMKPYLVNKITQDGDSLLSFEPKVINPSICSKSTLDQLKACLEGVVVNGTARSLYNNNYKIAGKTGTALVANGSRGYADKIYQSSFAGYFPADDPQYSIIVTIKNKPHAAKFYGAAVAGPVFKEIADQVYTLKVNHSNNIQFGFAKNDSSWYNYAGYAKDVKKVNEELELKTVDKSGTGNYVRMNSQGSGALLTSNAISSKQMPLLTGMGLKDAVYLCENIGLKVLVSGRGKVTAQSIVAGAKIAKGESVNIQLN